MFVVLMSRYMGGLSETIDIYSFGVILLELVSGREVIQDGGHIVTWVSRSCRYVFFFLSLIPLYPGCVHLD